MCVLFILNTSSDLLCSCIQDEIHKRPRISTLLESLSRYEAVASPQQDDEEGETKTTTSAQVKSYKSNLHKTLN